ncbi:hypothetical protein CR513_24766, partial [Mucuna pruriens]
MSAFAKTREVGSVLSAKEKLLVLLYKVDSLLQEVADVFPDEVSHGLPPLRGIEHQIDLILGCPIPNRPAYRTNPEETKEIQKQVKELLQKDFVRESPSPCSVPVILIPRGNMVHLGEEFDLRTNLFEEGENDRDPTNKVKDNWRDIGGLMTRPKTQIMKQSLPGLSLGITESLEHSESEATPKLVTLLQVDEDWSPY